MDAALLPFAKMLDDLLCPFIAIERFEEPSLLSEDRQSGRWGWGSWNDIPTPVLLKDDALFPSGDYTLDLSAGTAAFTTPVDAGVEVRASYNFRLLTYEHYDSYFRIGLSAINLRKPSTAYEFASMPSTWGGVLTLAAYEQACRTILLKLGTFRYRRLFENADFLATQLTANSASANAQWMAILPTLKRRGEVQPLGLATFNRNAPYLIDGINFRDYMVGRL